MGLPLAGTRVVAVEQYGAGPWATLQLADLGATVIKIEDPRAGGDVGRYVPPFDVGESSLFFETFNRNKLSVSLDLRVEAGRRAFEALVHESDILFSNLRGDLPEKLRLRYRDLVMVNPRIVCCALSGFGGTGPRAAEPAYDYVIQALTGWMSITGEPDGPPARSGLPLVDLSSGYVAAIAMLAALQEARRTGVGCDCDISLYETALHELVYLATWAASRDYQVERQPLSGHPSIVPFGSYATADGWIVVACPKEKFFRSLCDAIGRPDLPLDARFGDFAARLAHREELTRILGEAFAERTTEEWLTILAPARVPHSRVNDIATALQDPQVAARSVLAVVEHPELGPVRHVSSPLRVGDAPGEIRRGPFRGEHTYEVLTEVCGYSTEEIAALVSSGATDSVDRRADAGAAA